MKATTLPFLLFSTTLILPFILAEDFCDSEPHLQIQETTCESSQKPTILFRLTRLHPNPYHALHDSLWAISHYLIHCLLPEAKSKRIIIQTEEPSHELKNCSSESQLPILADDGKACWALHVMKAMAKTMNIELIGGEQRVVNCVEKRIKFPVDPGNSYSLGVEPPKGYVRKSHSKRLLGLTWTGRACLHSQKDKVCTDVGDGSNLEPELPHHLKAAAFRFVADVVRKEAGASLARKGQRNGPVRTLFYDRNDTSRRQWANSKEVYEALRRDKRLELRFVRKTPASVNEQVLMYSWADVIIAPHGAGMVNTIIMRPGTEIIEVWKKCGANKQFWPPDWTAWHAPLLDLNLQYVSCRYVPVLNGSTVIREGPRTTEVKEVRAALEIALKRLERRIDFPTDAHTESSMSELHRTNKAASPNRRPVRAQARAGQERITGDPINSEDRFHKEDEQTPDRFQEMMKLLRARDPFYNPILSIGLALLAFVLLQLMQKRKARKAYSAQPEKTFV